MASGSMQQPSRTRPHAQTRKHHADGDSLSLALFLAGLESTIIGTSLISITNELGGFQRSSWIVAAYLLGYASMPLYARCC